MSAPALPRLVVAGATDVAAALVWAGRFLGMRTVVCDPRPTFTTSARVPDADEVVVAWPHRWLARELDAGRLGRHTALAVLAHDPRVELPLLQLALRHRPRLVYVGAMGSRRAHTVRDTALRAAGLTDDDLGPLHSPIGLDLGGRTPAETATSIAAQIVAVVRARPASVRVAPTTRSTTPAATPIAP